MSNITKEQFAARINGRQYREEITRAECAEARDAGLLIAFGASDDLLEIRGVSDDEASAFGGGEFHLDAKGWFVETREDHDELVEVGWTPPQSILTLKAQWEPENLEASWLITSDAPFASFDIMEDGELYCRGCVIDFAAFVKQKG